MVAAVTGLVAIAAYATGAWLSGTSEGPGGGRVLFDGFAPPPPYRWVSPPPEVAADNRKPASASSVVPLAAVGSEARTVSTPDLQASIFLPPRAFARRPGQRSVVLSLEPRAASPSVSVGEGYAISGNVYRFAGRYQPDGAAIEHLEVAARIVLVYPAPPADPEYDHVLLVSSDGARWRVLQTMTATAQHQAAADVTELGLYSVGRRAQGTEGFISGPVRVAVLVALVLAAALVAYLGTRRRRAA